MKSRPAIEIGIVFYPGAQIAAAHGLGDLFGVANRIAAKHKGTEVGRFQVSHWRQLEPGAAPVREVEVEGKPTMLLIPPSLEDPITSEQAAPFSEWLRNQHRAGTALGSVCAGAFLLGETGLLAGRSVTTHWTYSETFQLRFPSAHLNTDRLIIDDGDIVTAGGVMAWADLGLKLVDRFLGPTIMVETARFMLVDPPGREQRYYSVFSPHLNHGDAAILKVQHWLQATGGKDMTLVTLARRAGLEERTFLRRFRSATGHTAVDYCQRLRIGRAQEHLQFGNASIEQVAWEVGYSDPGAFRKIFIRVTGLTPGEYRRRFTAKRTE